MAEAVRALARLPFRTKLAYGFGDLGHSLSYTIIGFFYLFYLTDVAHVNPALAGTALLIGRIWDAVIDPFIGYLSDRTHTRWGRRRPFLLFTAIPFGLTFLVIWAMPASLAPLAKLGYCLVSFMFHITAFSLCAIPYTALTPQLTHDYDERTSLTAYRMVFSILGGLVAAAVPIMIVNAFPDRAQGYLVMGAVFGFILVFSPAAVFFGTREAPARTPTSELSFLAGVRAVFRNRPFVLALMMYLTTWIAIDIVSAMMIYYLKYWLHMEPQAPIVLGSIFVAAIALLPFWVRLSGRIGKRYSYVIGMAIISVALLAIVLLPPSARFWVYGLAVLGGIGVSSAHVIPWAIVPDVIEYDEFKTGQRREASYTGFLSFLQQLASSGALFLVGISLNAAGYVPDVEQSARSLLAIRVLLGIVPGVLFAIGIGFVIAFPLTKARHEQLRRILERRRARANAG